ncbi:hypothetical protein CCAX7_005720 [Capsulimonas corticalis]|uniref:Uncharacterized protein n=1 Tax=Capsulimonas corticalis TaxID=2219043 RepID=A0A402D371_9BACT|nr:hypothetical protein [Capsulimonas corticalis]BDI28521.1 hypothetical protein CCAX7_005720 [Capsulimonas corticalis]
MQKLIGSTGARLTLAAGLGYLTLVSAHAEEWKANDKAAAQLQPAQTFDGFSVRLPASVASPTVADIADGKGKSYTWSLSPSDDKGGVFIIRTRPLAAGQTPDQILTDWTTRSVLTRLDDVGKSPAQSGTVGEGTFTRLYYHGREKTGAKDLVHGFVYVGVAQNHVFVIESQDPTGKYTASLPQTEAAALTLKAIAPDVPKPIDTGKELSSDAHAADLGAEIQTDGYALRPPKGYVRGELPMGDQGVSVTAWEGQPNEMGMRPMFVFRTTPVKGAHAVSPIEDGLDTGVEMLRRFIPSVQVDATQYGMVHGLECAYTTYTAAPNAQNFHGVIYSIHDGDKVIIAGGIDTAPTSDKSVPIIEAACRSIRKP